MSTPETPLSDIQKARQKFEAEKMNRRAALRKMGITSGAALFGMFALDDVARLVIKKMEEHKETHALAEGLAKEFKNAGVVYAQGVDNTTCDDCNTHYQNTINNICCNYPCPQYDSCANDALAAFNHCASVHCDINHQKHTAFMPCMSEQ